MASGLSTRPGKKELAFLNASGHSPYGATIDTYEKAGMQSMPLRGFWRLRSRGC